MIGQNHTGHETAFIFPVFGQTIKIEKMLPYPCQNKHGCAWLYVRNGTENRKKYEMVLYPQFHSYMSTLVYVGSYVAKDKK